MKKMNELSPMLIEKIESMDISDSRKRLIKKLFESQRRYSNSKLKANCIRVFRELVVTEMKNENSSD